jgi:uncharacterized glyoxalase superfamily protein PhnB
MKIKPTRGFDDYFGAETPRKRVIHVLVELPDQVPSPAALSSVSILEAIQQQVAQTQEQVLKLIEEKRKDVKISTKKGKQFTQSLHLHVEEVSRLWERAILIVRCICGWIVMNMTPHK